MKKKKEDAKDTQLRVWKVYSPLPQNLITKAGKAQTKGQQGFHPEPYRLDAKTLQAAAAISFPTISPISLLRTVITFSSSWAPASMHARYRPTTASRLLNLVHLSWLSTLLLVFSGSKGTCKTLSKLAVQSKSIAPSIWSSGVNNYPLKKDPGGAKQLWGPGEAGQKIWIVDTFPYNGEIVAELRLKHLFRDVDEFIVVESRVTHSGKKKDFLYVERDWKSFEPYLSKVSFLIINDFPVPGEAWVESNRGTWMNDPTVWHREMYQRDVAASKIQEKYAGRRFVVLCSDADEIPHRDVARELRTQGAYDQAHKGFYMAMKFSYYNFNWASPQAWIKGFAVSDVGLRQQTLSDYRMGNPYNGTIRQDGGWHFSYYMSAADIARKLNAFGHTEYNKPQYRDSEHVKKCLHEGKDLFNRGPSFDMLHATADRRAGYPEGWEEFGKKLSELQNLPAVPHDSILEQTRPGNTN